MTKEQLQVIDQLRAEGYAITVWTPEEMKGADPDGLEDVMIERGSHYIEQWKLNVVG